MNTDSENLYSEEVVALMNVSPRQFSELVTGNVPELVRRGYSPEPSEHPFVVWFWKQLDEGVRCAVRFELLPYFEPQGFQATVLRRRQRVTVNRDRPYAPVLLDLRNVASLLFGKELFTPDRFYWDFSDKMTLIQKAAEAQIAIIEYGLPWIEDPKSNTGKIKTLMRKAMQAKGTK